jgi:hypothetical protein
VSRIVLGAGGLGDVDTEVAGARGGAAGGRQPRHGSSGRNDGGAAIQVHVEAQLGLPFQRGRPVGIFIEVTNESDHRSMVSASLELRDSRTLTT